jgi:hypothetical protein
MNSEQFCYIKETANLLMLANNNEVLNNIETIISLFPNVSLHQMKTILSSYQVDKSNAQDHMPEFCLKLISTDILADEEEEILLPQTLSFADYEEFIYSLEEGVEM